MAIVARVSNATPEVALTSVLLPSLLPASTGLLIGSRNGRPFLLWPRRVREFALTGVGRLGTLLRRNTFASRSSPSSWTTLSS